MVMRKVYDASRERGSNTNLTPPEGLSEEIGHGVICKQWSDAEQIINGINGARLDEHDDDGRVQSAGLAQATQCFSKIPDVQNEPRNNHGCEEDIKREANEMVR